jgi:hypothetical protein
MESGQFEARAGREGLLRSTYEMLVAKEETSSSIGSPTFSTLAPFVWHQCTATINAVNESVNVRSFQFSYRNNIPIDNLYAFSTREPTRIRVGRAELTGTVEFIFDDTNQYTLFKNATEFAMKFDFVGTSPYQLTFDLPKCVYRTAVPNPDRREQIVIPAQFEARHDTTEATPLKVTLINQVASYA